MKDIFAEEKPAAAKKTKAGFRLHYKLFLLVFGVALLWQSLIFMDMRLTDYARTLQDSFKIILKINGPVDSATLTQIGESLNQKKDIASVKLYSPQEAMETVQKQNPQLVQAVLLMGKNKMPAYFEVKLTPQGMNNAEPLADSLAAEYAVLTPYYNRTHASFAFYAALCSKILRITLVVALLVFLLFMFLVEAAQAERSFAYTLGGVVSGMLAGVLAAGVMALFIFPTGLLVPAVAAFTTWGRQILLVTFCALMGWTLAKWQKF